MDDCTRCFRFNCAFYSVFQVGGSSGSFACVVGTHDNPVAGKTWKSTIDEAVYPEVTYEIAQINNSHGCV
jgi:hypothetical protein